jgi:hypothetical protein
VPAVESVPGKVSGAGVPRGTRTSEKSKMKTPDKSRALVRLVGKDREAKSRGKEAALSAGNWQMANGGNEDELKDREGRQQGKGSQGQSEDGRLHF